MFSIIDREAMEREEAELKAAQAAKEAEKKATAATIPSSRVMPPTPPSSRWDGTDTLRTPITETVVSEPAPKESKSLQSWFFTDEAETDRFAEPEPPPSAKSESFFSGWTIFETLFGSRTNTKDDTTTTTGFFSGPIPRRTGWLFIDMFLSEKTATVARQPGFSLLTKFLLLAVPLIAFAGYYQYASVSGATILGKTLSNSVNLERGLVGHWTFDGGDMSSTTAYDISGNGYDMSFSEVFNSSITKPSIGRIGQGIEYSGGSGCSQYRVNTIPTSMVPQTISVWINPRSISSSQMILARGTGASNSANGWFLRLVGGTTAAALEFEVGFNTTDLTRQSESSIIKSNEWQHIVTTWDGSNLSSNVKIYKNGLEVSSYSITQNGSSIDDEDWSDIWLGRSSGGSSCFDGTLDDVRIYNRILSAKEIERLYKMGEGVKINTNTIPTGSTLEDGLVGYWSFNGADFTDKVYDRSGQNNHGYLVNMATTSAKVPGKVGQGLSFDGVNDYVSVSGSESVKTLSYWIKADRETNGGIELNANQYVNDNTAPQGWTSPTIYIDGTPQTTSYGSDIAVNGDFSADITGWTTKSGVSTVSWQNAVSGDGSTGYHRFNINNNVNWDRYRHTTNIISANTAYRVSFWYRTSGITGNMRAFFTSDHATMANALFSQDIVPSTGWQYVSLIMTSTSASHPIFGFMKYGSVGSGTFDVDAVSIEPVTTHHLITDTDWHHVAITTDTTITANTIKLGKGGLSYLDGTIDEVRIYNRVLSADEVRQLYESGGGVTIKNCKENSVQDADGNTYNTLAIGSQCWLDRNMNVGTRISGATTQINNGTIEKYCYSNTDSNCTANNPNKPDGGLYQWNEAMQYSTTEGARGICPAGFHIPTDAEWHALEKFLTNSQQSCNPTRSGAYDCSPAGTKLQPNGSSRFEGNRAGGAVSGSFLSRGTGGYWWSSSPSGGNAWYRSVVSGEARVGRYADTQSYGLSVRCLQD